MSIRSETYQNHQPTRFCFHQQEFHWPGFRKMLQGIHVFRPISPSDQFLENPDPATTRDWSRYQFHLNQRCLNTYWKSGAISSIHGGRTYCQQPDFHRHWFFAVSFVSILLLTPAALRNAASEIYALCANQFRLENICLQLSVHSEHQGSLTFTKTSAFCGRIRCNNHHLGLSQLSPMQSKGIQQPKGQMWMWRLIFAQTHGFGAENWGSNQQSLSLQEVYEHDPPANNHFQGKQQWLYVHSFVMAFTCEL